MPKSRIRSKRKANLKHRRQRQHMAQGKHNKETPLLKEVGRAVRRSSEETRG